jgi:tetratricopeptide (TPR) repeat protein
MPEKKKPSVLKTAEPQNTAKPAPRAGRTQERPRSAAPGGAAAIAQPLDSEKQLRSFEAAMKLFHARRFQEALVQFELAAAGPERDVAHRARSHAVMCQRRLEQQTVNLTTAEDYYNYGVAMLNVRKAAEARANLEKALELAPGADHVHYALALAHAMAGNLAGAHDSLKAAIAIEPRNRIIARQDADFASLANQSPFDALLYPEKKSW